MPTTESGLHAAPGDRLVIKGHHVGEPVRDAEILEVLGPAGAPPYLVRWDDSGHVTRVYPSSDAYVQHFEHESRHESEQVAERPPSIAAEWESAKPPMDS